MLASDPHRAIALPALRYLVHLNAPGWNVIGAGEPALPGVALGHNERIAWGITIVGTDQADIFVEEINPLQPQQYKVGAEWRASDKLALRVGINYAESPIKGSNTTAPIPTQGGFTSNAAFANYLFPAITESHFTLGLSYKMDKNLSISGYYLHAPEVSETAETSSLGGSTVPGTTISMTQNAFGLGVSYAAK